MSTHYPLYAPISLPHRTWPTQQLSQAPRWCSLDLHLGTQSLLIPMDINNKISLFLALVAIGLKEIGISNPARSEDDLIFLTRLVNDKLIPDDVKIQVTFPCDLELSHSTI
jgi:2-isopropylmalate synthase